MGSSDHDARLTVFQEQRPRLFALAYRLLGSAASAEDIVQEAYLRWSGAAEGVEVPAAWLTKVVTNLCLNELASARARRERYVGPWLPEPVLTRDGDGALGPLETLAQRETVSLGVLVLLERLAPAERAVFVLREAFGHSHAEVADILGVSEANSRQLHRRARTHVSGERPRFDVSPQLHRAMVDAFLKAAAQGDLAGLEKLLAAEVVAWSDGGGAARTARRPIHGRDKVLRYLLGVAARPEASTVTVDVDQVNGEPALLVREGSVLRAVVALEIGTAAGTTHSAGTGQAAAARIVGVRTVVNEAKLAFAAAQLA
ncbi:RNA polymerase sigma factor SigJ [Streptomyces beihaiensis]|uniref:RNA polymerase sigma factor SigJ n=1 Tax=Streptomyces beihaiensis TaxID=2984495 RepID=A0ABT3U3W9_9ACTN|nr:RNA polymerase sigma factor SigJ [Streptomyces beihaiensis]MCX3064028.1 RNA polymerase sigma factor SigJ [Streptomyces beihaiensis]